MLMHNQTCFVAQSFRNPLGQPEEPTFLSASVRFHLESGMSLVRLDSNLFSWRNPHCCSCRLILAAAWFGETHLIKTLEQQSWNLLVVLLVWWSFLSLLSTLHFLRFCRENRKYRFVARLTIRQETVSFDQSCELSAGVRRQVAPWFFTAVYVHFLNANFFGITSAHLLLRIDNWLSFVVLQEAGVSRLVSEMLCWFLQLSLFDFLFLQGVWTLDLQSWTLEVLSCLR